MQYNSTVIQDVHVMHWNAQGITTESAVSQLEQVLLNKKIDVLFLNETFLKSHHKFKIGSFKVYREDRSTHGGGVLIAIRNNIEHRVLPKCKTYKIENISIEIIINRRPVIFTSAYSPVYTGNFKKDIHLLTNLGKEFFIFGDFNARHSHWNCVPNNTAGNELYSHSLQSNYYIYHTNSFTRFGQNLNPIQPSTVDILLTNSNIPFSSLESHPNLLNSDHVPISCYIHGQYTHVTLLIPLYNKADWRAIRTWVENEIISQNLDQFEIVSDNIDLALDNIIAIAKEAFNKIPTARKNSWQREISDTSKMLIGQRNRYKRKLQRCLDVNKKMEIKSILCQLNRLIDFHVPKDRNDNWSIFISKLPSGSKKFWKLTKAFKGKTSNLGDLHVNGEILKSGKDKANAIADAFEKFHTITLNNLSSMDNTVSNNINILNNDTFLHNSDMELTNLNEIKSHVLCLKNNKSPGL